jgi:hypothetical protein
MSVIKTQIPLAICYDYFQVNPNVHTGVAQIGHYPEPAQSSTYNPILFI